MVEPALFGPIDSLLAPIIEWVVLVLVAANLATRAIAHRSHVRQAAEGGAEAIRRHPGHQAVTILLVLASFYLTTVQYHAGFVMSVLVLGMVLTDFFEFEARKVEAREDRELERPKGSLFASFMVAAYAGYLTLFFVIEPLWNAIV